MGRIPRPPSYILPINFPVFGLSWTGGPDRQNETSTLAYCGGGGSARTGVGNNIVVVTKSREDGSPIIRKIDTGDQIAVCVTLSPQGQLLTGVGDEVRLYNVEDGELLCAAVCAGRGGVNTVAFSGDWKKILVGCESGPVLMYTLEDGAFNLLAECLGHEKAVCSVVFHPLGGQCLSSAKDGTARVWDAFSGKELAILECSNEQEMGVKPKMKFGRPTQILVRGCAYGADGCIYTVSSGKRGKAILTKWGQEGDNFFEVTRFCCSDVPISAVSTSGDKITLTLGSVEGSILLFDIVKGRVVKRFVEIHDLPVTCIAAKPSQLSYDEDFVDVVSASADSKLAFLSRQRESWSFNAILFMILVPIFFAIVVRAFFEICEEEMKLFDIDASRECVVSSLVADASRHGLLIPPH